MVNSPTRTAQFTRIPKLILRLVGGCAFVLTVIASQPVTAQKKYVFGVFPFLPPATLLETYGPIAAIMSHALDKKIEFQTKPTFQKFKAALAKQIYDIALVQPFDYIDAADKFGYRPIARGILPLRAVFAVLPTSDIRRLEDLKGRRIATPPSSAAVRYLAFEKLRSIGLKPNVDIRFLSLPSHPACLKSVLIGDVASCVTTEISIRLFRDRRQVSFRVVAKTSAIPHIVFVAHSRVPERDRMTLRKSLLKLKETEKGRTLLLRLKRPQGFVAASDTDYDIVRALAKKYSAK